MMMSTTCIAHVPIVVVLYALELLGKNTSSFNVHDARFDRKTENWWFRRAGCKKEDPLQCHTPSSTSWK